MRKPSPFALAALCILTIVFILLTSQYHTDLKSIKYFSYRSTTPPPWENSTDRFLPLDYALDRLTYYETYASNSCATFPSLVDLHYASPYWQSLKVGNGTANLYGAYWDDRKEDVVRLLIVYDRLVCPKLYCHLWYKSQGRPVTVPVTEIIYGWKEEWGGPFEDVNEPYILTCPVVRDKQGKAKVPSAVSIVVKPCDNVVTALKVQNKPKPANKKHNNIAVCVKWMLYPDKDVSVRLVEWLELVKLFGAEKVFIPLLQAHPNVLKVLSEYSEAGFVDVTEYGFPPPKGFRRMLQNRYIRERNAWKEELLPYNDCLYRNLKQYNYLAALDIDEIIVPVTNPNWISLLQSVVSKDKVFDSYHANNIYFLDILQNKIMENDDIPEYSHMLKHVWRTQNFSDSGDFIKSFYLTDRVLAMHNHAPIKCLYGHNNACKNFEINAKLARLQHYRKDCYGHLKRNDCDKACKNPVRDTTLWKWRDILIINIKNRLKKLDLLPVKI